MIRMLLIGTASAFGRSGACAMRFTLIWPTGGSAGRNAIRRRLNKSPVRQMNRVASHYLEARSRRALFGLSEHLGPNHSVSDFS
jgi:hypothetical protein